MAASMVEADWGEGHGATAVSDGAGMAMQIPGCRGRGRRLGARRPAWEGERHLLVREEEGRVRRSGGGPREESASERGAMADG